MTARGTIADNNSARWAGDESAKMQKMAAHSAKTPTSAFVQYRNLSPRQHVGQQQHSA